MTHSENHDVSDIQLWRMVAAAQSESGSCLTPTELAGYIDGTFSPGQIERIETHLAACSACLASIRELRVILAEQAAVHVLVPPAIIDRAQSLVAEQSPRTRPLEAQWRFAALWSMLRYPTAAAAAIAGSTGLKISDRNKHVEQK